ncbi:MAG TPA: quinone oxidoreductase [Kofleriaceae bacterium]|nr:quinone oxidoreductase [Kofleriaceae bacterium]
MKVRAIQIREHGGPEVLQLVELELGDPGPGEVRVRHHAIGVNFIDTYHRSGLYPVPMPCVLGTEGAGIVDAVGADVSHVAVGDRVVYAARTPGSYADARLVGAAQVCKLPDSISFETGAAMMLKGMTVQYLLRQTLPREGLSPGDEIVWHAAAGGVGQIACQWAKALGLVVIGTAGSPAKCELARKAGAAHVIDYHAEDVVARVMAITKGRGVKVVYDGVGKDTWQRSIDCLQPFGLMVSFGNASGPVPPISLGSLTPKSLYVTRPTLGTYTTTRERTQAIADDLFAMMSSGKVAIAVDQKYPLADAARAHRDLESRKTVGASVLVP